MTSFSIHQPAIGSRTQCHFSVLFCCMKQRYAIIYYCIPQNIFSHHCIRMLHNELCGPLAPALGFAAGAEINSERKSMQISLTALRHFCMQRKFAEFTCICNCTMSSPVSSLAGLYCGNNLSGDIAQYLKIGRRRLESCNN